MELTNEELELLTYHAALVDMNLSAIAKAEDGIRASTQLFDHAWKLAVRSRGLDPDNFRAIWDGQKVRIDKVEQEVAS